MISQNLTNFSPPTEQQKNNFKQAKNFFSLGKVLAKKGEWEEAIAAYQKAIKLAPDWGEVKQYLADAENKLQQKTANSQEQQEASGKLTMAEQFGKILATQKRSDLEKVTAGDKTIKVDSNLTENYHLQGDALVEKGEKEEAIKVYRKAVEIQPELWEVHHKLGNLLQEREELEAAVDAYNKSIELKPDFAWSYNNLGDVLVKLEKKEEAIAYYQKVIELEPNFAWSYYNLAEVSLQLEHWDKAVEAYRKFMKIQPNFSPKVEEKLNQALHQQVKRKSEQALSYYRQAIENDPTDVESYEKALEIKPDDAELYLAWGNALVAKGEEKKAVIAFEKAIAINPNLAPVNYQLPTIYQEIDNIETIISNQLLKLKINNYKKALQTTPNNSELYINLAVVMTQQSRLSQAIDIYKLALYFQPESDRAKQGLEEVIEKKNRLNQAFQNSQTVSPLYSIWLKENLPSISEIEWMPEQVEFLGYKPLISIIVPVYNTPEPLLKAMIQSVLDQIYPYWELCIADDASPNVHVKEILKDYAQKDERIKVIFREENGHISANSNSALSLATGDFISLLDHDDVLTPDALYEVVLLLNKHPEADMIYSDEDKINEADERLDPFFKPDWCPDSFLSRMYICHLGTYRRSIIEEIGGFRVGYEGSQDYDLVLRFTEKTDKIFHIPKVLYNWRIHSESAASGTHAKPYAYDAGARAIEDALVRRGEKGKVIPHSKVAGTYTVRYEIQEYKKVSIIIPTRNLGTILDRCLESIFTKSTYPNYEVILIDNGSDEDETFNVFDKWKEREPNKFFCYQLDIPFNYSRLNNYGVFKATGDYILLLNNDTEVITSDWIEAMVEQAQRPTIGAVGALLLYPDDTVQHAGVVLGVGGIAGHSHKNFSKDDEGYVRQLISVSNYCAVTAACLMCRREVFEQVGGLDEKLKVAFNDVNFCLAVKHLGYNNIYLPHVILYHYESKSRGAEDTPEKQQRFKQETDDMNQRWGKLIANDPCYSPNLTLEGEDYKLKIKTRPEIVEVCMIEQENETLWGCSLDMPQIGKLESGLMTVAGWIVGRQAPVEKLAIFAEEKFVQEIAINTIRPDVAQVFSHVEGAENSGFTGVVNIMEFIQNQEFSFKVILKNGASVLIARVKLSY
ncbi:MAG: glycosyltransferase [Crocosphaera sp.]